MKKQKESIVIFEDWFRYARCLNDSEFRTFMNTILQYYKEPFTPQFTGLMLEVWNDIIDDLEKNIQSRQNRRDTIEKNRQKNSKVNPLLRPTTMPTGRPTINPTTNPTSTPDTNGMVMVDGRLNMVDNKMVNDGMIEGGMLNRGFIISQFNKGITTSSLIEQYPRSQSLIKETYLDYDF